MGLPSTRSASLMWREMRKRHRLGEYRRPAPAPVGQDHFHLRRPWRSAYLALARRPKRSGFGLWDRHAANPGNFIAIRASLSGCGSRHNSLGRRHSAVLAARGHGSSRVADAAHQFLQDERGRAQRRLGTGRSWPRPAPRHRARRALATTMQAAGPGRLHRVAAAVGAPVAPGEIARHTAARERLPVAAGCPRRHARRFRSASFAVGISGWLKTNGNSLRCTPRRQ
jgi:hypothetical protein